MKRRGKSEKSWDEDMETRLLDILQPIFDAIPPTGKTTANQISRKTGLQYRTVKRWLKLIILIKSMAPRLQWENAAGITFYWRSTEKPKPIRKLRDHEEIME